MAINLAKNYSGKIAQKFTAESYTAGNSSKEWDFAGARSITIYTPKIVAINDYQRSGQNRFGTLEEVQDEIQELELTQDKGFTGAIDRGNNADQMNTKRAGDILNQQIKEGMTPLVDKYNLSRWANLAGKIDPLSAEPTKTTIVEKIFDGAAVLDNALVPPAERYCYLPTKYYNLLRLSGEFLAVDNLAIKSLEKGMVGMVADMKIIKVPDTYAPANTYFLITHKNSVLAPMKIKTMRILNEVQGVDGRVLEGRYYYDAFVLGARAGGVYAAVASGKQTTAPVIEIASNSATITAASGVTFYYTTDGSDPRYSKTAKVYSSGVSLTSGQTIKAYGEKTDEFRSAVSSATNS